MIAVLDAAYGDASSAVSCVLADDWTAAEPTEVLVKTFDGPPAEYEPGAFYKRELPLLEEMMRPVDAALEAIIIDGYVYLDRAGRPGLGAKLYDVLDGRAPVVGVAKSHFKEDDFSERVFRGEGETPLFVTAIGMATADAGAYVRAMDGAHRIPTLLGRADRAAREALEG